MITAIGNDPGFQRAWHARGFTLIEMLAVIALIAIAVTVTAMSLHGRGRWALDATAQQMAAGLRDARVRAMASHHSEAFTLDLHRHTFAAPGHDPRAWPVDTSVRVTSAAEDATRPDIASIRYFPDGSSSGGNIVLSQSHRSVRVDVDWLTGAVSVDRQAPSS